ncbi:MAG: hypothetical protein PHZ26_03305 [Candidatus Gracilibacteria bacterium]|nr:hypothetical protein [Candidatus Gracilibacteria bacterium]MDD2908755.1 hypothetical protein [Candidatus Gracilibacteria bacterium]
MTTKCIKYDFCNAIHKLPLNTGNIAHKTKWVSECQGFYKNKLNEIVYCAGNDNFNKT